MATFTKTFNLSTMFSDTDWMREIDEHGAVCAIHDQFGAMLARGEVGLRHGEPVVMVDDDAHTVLTVDEIADARYQITVVMPGPLTAGFDDPVADCAAHGQFVARIVERASRLAIYGLPVSYKLG